PPMLIRAFDPARDEGFVRECVKGLQNVERELDPRLPPADQMVDAYLDALDERVREWEGAILIAEEAGAQVGYLSMFCRVPETEPDEPAGVYALISDLFVDPAHRRGGVASALVEAAEKLAGERGVPVIRLEVLAAN